MSRIFLPGKHTRGKYNRQILPPEVPTTFTLAKREMGIPTILEIPCKRQVKLLNIVTGMPF